MRKQGTKHHRAKPPKRGGHKPPASVNTQLGRQIRKILGKHYANKYRVR